MKRHSLPAALLLCGVLFMACEKEDTSYNTTYGVQYQLATSNPSTVLGTVPTEGRTAQTLASVSWRSGSAVARRIRFEGTGEDEIDIRTGVPTPIQMVGPATSLGILEVPAGTYEEVRFTIELSRTDPFQLTGDFNGTPLLLQVTDPIDIELERDALTIDALTNYTALTTLNLSSILAGITADMLSEATVSNGQILISATSNTRLYQIILANMKSLGELEFGKQ